MDVALIRACATTRQVADAWSEARDQMRDSRNRSLALIAAAYGCDVALLPPEVTHAVSAHGHECYQVALVYVHERDTTPAPPRLSTDPPPLPAALGPGTIGTYHQQPATRVDRLYRNKKPR